LRLSVVLLVAAGLRRHAKARRRSGQRTQELAIRRALVARAADVIRPVAGYGLRMVAVRLQADATRAKST